MCRTRALAAAPQDLEPLASATLPEPTPTGTPSTAAPPDASPGEPATTPAPRSADPSLGPLAERHRADVRVAGATSLPHDLVGRLEGLAEPGAALAYRSGTVDVGGTALPAVAVDPGAFRAFVASATAEATAVWQAVARGEAVASHDAASRLGLVLGDPVTVTPSDGGPPRTLRLGALATTGLPATDLVVDDAVGATLGLSENTGVLLARGAGGDPARLAEQARDLAGGVADVDLLTSPAPPPVAFLSGGAAGKAFGAFSYRYFPDGTIEPDAAWVKANIVTETVPVLGKVTCHRLMVTQLRGALTAVRARGLDGTLRINSGCYVPRFIERNPSRPISLHTWGIAIDLDAPSNGRGTTGTMDPAVVEIFKRWGFRWGGDWSYTDPMHFELGAVLSEPPR